MLPVNIFIVACVLGIIIFTIWCVNLVLVPVIKMQQSGVGERTKFIVDTSDKGYEYYEKFVNDWLEYNKFPKYSKKINGRILKYYISDLIFKYGFNHYKDKHYMVIEVWLSVFGKENPLSYKYFSNKNGTDIMVNQQGKDEYLIFLSSFINIPEIVQDANNVTLKEKYDLSKIKNQKLERKKNHKTIFIILAISLSITVVLFLLGLI